MHGIENGKRILASAAAAALLICAAAPCASAASVQDGGLSLTAEEQAYLETHDSLKVGFVQDRIPVSFADENGELAGISRYIFDELQEISGLQFEYVGLPAGAVTYDYLLGEGFDLVTSVEYNEENRKARGIMISNPYLSSRKVIVARDDFSFSYDAPFSVAISSGSQTIRKVLAEIFPNYELVDYDSIEACFDAVNDGKADFLLQNQYVAEYWLYRPAYEGMKVIPAFGLDDQLCFSAVVPFDENGLPVGTDGDTLISILDKAIAQLNEEEVDGYTIQAVMENQYQFRLSDFLYRYRYTIVLMMAAAALIVLLVLLLIRQRVRSLAERADARAKGQFLSTMSHEIRTPLNGLIGLNYLITQKLHDEKQMSAYLRQSTETARYLLSLVDDILDMSRLQGGEMELEEEPVDLRLLFSTVVSLAQTEIKEKGQTFHTDLHIECPGIMGDQMRIQQVLLNLLDNARKFTPKGGRVCLVVRQTMTEDGMVCTHADVSDTGRGMSEEFKKQIFQSFAQERDTVSKGNEGTGLGLAISHRLAKLMGGDLEFTSKKDEGSTFFFSFRSRPAELVRGEEQQAVPDGAEEKGMGVLVAEDNELNGEIMTELLNAAGFRVKLAENGKKALECFEASAPGEYGAVLMDLLMPEMDGFTAASAIRALDRSDAETVKIFACSANCTQEDRDRAKASGMDDFLAKPVNIQELLRKLSG